MTSVCPPFGPFNISSVVGRVLGCVCLFVKFINICTECFEGIFTLNLTCRFGCRRKYHPLYGNVCLAIIVFFVCFIHVFCSAEKSLVQNAIKKIRMFLFLSMGWPFRHFISSNVVCEMKRPMHGSRTVVCLLVKLKPVRLLRTLCDEMGSETKKITENDKRCIRHSNRNHVFNRQRTREMRGCALFSFFRLGSMLDMCMLWKCIHREILIIYAS